MQNDNGDYKPYVYTLAKLSMEYHHIINLNNLFKRFFYMALILIISALIAETGIYIITKIVLILINLVRVAEYEKPINYAANGFSVILLGNISVLVLGIVYLIEAKVDSFVSSLHGSIAHARKELEYDEKQRNSQNKSVS